MGNVIDQKIVEMKFDNRNFENNIKTTMNTLDNFKSKLNFSGLANSIDNIGVSKTKLNLEPILNAMSTVKTKISAIQVMAVTALSNITNSAINAGKRITAALTIDPIRLGLSEYETQINSVQTILANTESKGTTLQQVNKALAELNEYSDKTIYNFTEMTRNIGTFTAAGIDLKTSVSAIKGIANLAAVSGSTSQQASNAMYQLSQALASGTVKLMDWNSVVNSGMGGQVFQDALKETAKVHNINVDAMIKKEGSFRETLQKGWLTSDILTETLHKFTMAAEEGTEKYEEYKKSLKEKGYTEEQAKEILKLANTATDAATKVKTFSQLWSTLQESAQSGWTKTWEILVGDFEEAKEALTGVSNAIGDIINKSSESRNKFLSRSLSTGWKQLLDEGIPDEEGLKEELIKVTKNYKYNFEELIKETEKKGGSFQDALKKAFNDKKITTDMLSNSIENLSNKMSKMSIKELEAAGYTKDHIIQINEFNKKIKDGTINLEYFVDKISKKSGRENIIEALSNSFQGLSTILKSIKTAFREIFPAIKSEQLYKFTEKLSELSNKFKEFASNNSKKIENTFKGIFSVIKVGTDIIFSFGKIVGSLIGKLFGLSDGVLNVTSSIGKMLSEMQKGISESKLFSGVTKNLTKLFDKLFGILGAANRTVIQKVWVILQDLGDWISLAIKNFFETVGDAFNNGNIEKALNLFNQGALGFLIGNMSRYFKYLSKGGNIIETVNKFISNTQQVIKNISSVLDGVKDSLVSFQQSLKAGVINKIAKSIGILALSLIALSGIDRDKLAMSLSAITTLFISLIGSVEILGLDTLKNATNKLKALTSMATAVLILVFALKKLDNMNLESEISGVVSIIFLMKYLVKSIIMLNDYNMKITDETKKVKNNKILFSLIIYSKAIDILAKAISRLGKLDSKNLSAIMIGISGILSSLLAFIELNDQLSNTSGKKMFSISFSLIAFGTAMNIIAKSFIKLGSLDVKGIEASLLSLAGIISIIIIYFGAASSSKNVSSSSYGLILFAAAMEILADVTKKLADLNIKQIGTSLAGMGGILIELVSFMWLLKKTLGKRIFSKKMANNLIKTSIALTIMSKGMSKMADTLTVLSKIKFTSLAKAILGLGSILFVYIQFMKSLNKMPRSFKDIWDDMFNMGAIDWMMGVFERMYKVFEKFKDVEWSDLVQGLISISLILAETVYAVKRLKDEDELSLVIAAGGIFILAKAISSIAKVGWAGAGAVVILGASLGTLFGALILFKKHRLSRIMPFIAKGIAEVSGSILLLGLSIGAIGAGLALFLTSLIAAFVGFKVVRWEDIGKGLSAIAGSLVVFGIAAFALKKVTFPMLKLSLAIFTLGAACSTVALSINLIVYALQTMASMTKENAISATESIKILISGILDIIPIAAVKIGEALIEFLKTLVASVPQIEKIILELGIMLIDILKKLIPYFIEGILSTKDETLKILDKYIPSIANSIINILIKILDIVTKRVPELVSKVSTLLKVFIDEIIKAINSVDANKFEKNIESFKKIGELAIILAGVNYVGGKAMLGTLKLAVVIGEIIVLLTALGEISKIPGLDWFLNAGGNILEIIGTAIGKFIGGITGGIAEGFSDSMPKIATNLSEFMKNIKPFFDILKTTDTEQINKCISLANTIKSFFGAGIIATIQEHISDLDSLPRLGASLSLFMNNASGFIAAAKTMDAQSMLNIKILAEAITLITADNLVTQMTKFFSGDPIENFVKKLDDLSTGLCDFISSFDNTNFKNIDNITKMSNMVKTLSESGLYLSENNYSESLFNFTKKLPDIGGSLMSFLNGENSIKDLTGEMVGKITLFKDAITILKSSSEGIENSGGLAGWILGEDDLNALTKDLPNVSKSLMSFLNGENSIKDLTGEMVGKITLFKDAITILKSSSEGIENSGGLAGWILGEDDLNALTKDLPNVSKSLMSFLDGDNGIKDLTTDKIGQIAIFKEALSVLTTGTYDISGGVFGLVQKIDEEDFSILNDCLPKLGKAVCDFTSNISKLSSDNTNNLSIVMKALELLHSFKDIDLNGIGDNLKKFSNGLDQFGKKLPNVIKNITDTKVDKIPETVNKMKELFAFMKETVNINIPSINEFSNSVKKLGQDAVKGFVSAFGPDNTKKQIEKNTKQMIENVRIGLVSITSKSKVQKAFEFLIKGSIRDTMNEDVLRNMKNAGRYFVSGFVKGIEDNIGWARSVAWKLGHEAVLGTANGIDSHSPSKESKKLGNYFGEGLVIGIKNYFSKVYDAGIDIGDNAKSGLKNALNNVQKVINGEIGEGPVIRPVMDLTDIENGTSELTSMLNGKTMDISTNANAISKQMNKNNQNANKYDLISEIHDLNKKINDKNGDTYNINGVTYDDGSNIKEAVSTLIKAAKIERRT